ncbi:DUF1573 domain-containing protein [Roseivirga pacifica]|uniref:DUF1573 domain-containing protein n=1 Tax=Roseivirga pacifica TaxID=1267423 RepID=UPI003BAA3199
MKKILFSLVAFCVLQVAAAQEQVVATGPQIKFEETLFKFENIIQGDTVEHTFTFENIGTEPLKILSARGSCGCTVPKYSKDPIAPGEKGEVFVRFKSAGKRGMQNKTVTLITNMKDNQQVVLTIRGEVMLRDTEKPEE